MKRLRDASCERLLVTFSLQNVVDCSIRVFYVVTALLKSSAEQCGTVQQCYKEID